MRIIRTILTDNGKGVHRPSLRAAQTAQSTGNHEFDSLALSWTSSAPANTAQNQPQTNGKWWSGLTGRIEDVLTKPTTFVRGRAGSYAAS